MVRQSANLFGQGEIETAVITLNQIRGLIPDFTQLPTELTSELSSNIWNDLCWWGSLNGHAANVLDACEVAVQLAPDDGWVRDSRGLARALTGDIDGAIADFQFFLDWGQGRNEEWRASWIETLQADQNPFDEATLEALRNE